MSETPTPSGLHGPPAQELTAEMREAARQRPGRELYVIDPRLDPAGQVPGFGILGYYEVGSSGDIGAWRPNPLYSGRRVRDHLHNAEVNLDQALEQLRTGLIGIERVVDLLATSEIWISVGDHGGIVIVEDDQGRQFSSVYTAVGRSAVGHNAGRLERRNGGEVLGELPRPIIVSINPRGPIGVNVTITD